MSVPISYLSLVAIVEPNTTLVSPYQAFANSKVVRMSSAAQFLSWLGTNAPDLVCLSATLTPKDSLQICEALVSLSRSHGVKLPALLWVVDHTVPLSQVVGTTWSGQVGIVTNLSSPSELNSTLERILA